MCGSPSVVSDLICFAQSIEVDSLVSGLPPILGKFFQSIHESRLSKLREGIVCVSKIVRHIF